jgi:hypothetical protein
MRLKSRRRVMPKQFQRIQKRLTYLPVHNHVAGRNNATGKSRHNENTLRLDRPGPCPYRGNQLDVTTAHASEQKEEIKNSSRQQHA